jgi:20S proteasome subunit alpha 6
VFILTLSADLPSLINHGLSALADTLQQDKHLTTLNTSIAIIGPASAEVEDVNGSGAARRGFFRVYENNDIDALLRTWRRSRGEPEDGPDAEESADATAAADAPAATEAAAEAEPAQPPAGDDVEMQ